MSSIRETYAEFLHRTYLAVGMVAEQSPQCLREVLRYHLQPLYESKGFRPALVAACAGGGKLASPHRAAIVQLMHESSLIFDDIIDRDAVRRGQPAVHVKYGERMAGFAGAWIVSQAASMAAFDGFGRVDALNECSQAMIEAEAIQWDLRGAPRPLPLATIERIADGDTVALFVLAARLGDAEDLAPVRALGRLYHFLDDLSDLFGCGALGGGGAADIRDHIPTLLSAFTAGEDLEAQRAVAGEALASIQHYWSVVERAAYLRPFRDDLWAIQAALVEAGCPLEQKLTQP